MSNTAATMTTAGEKVSSFAVTCNLLSQYIKGKGRSLGDLALVTALRPNASPIGQNNTYGQPTNVSGGNTKEHVSDRDDTKSMDLFPQRAGFGPQMPPAVDKREPEKSQLTIFYKGKVLVFDNFPAAKTKDLMMLAGKDCAVAKNSGVNAPASAVAAVAASEAKNLSPNLSSSNPRATVQGCPPRPILSDLPIARKASLHRFLEKRKDRINAKAPYELNPAKDSPKDSPATAAAAPMMEETRPWLASLNSGCSR